MPAAKKIKEPKPEAPKSCFVIMPISDVEPYPSGHWARVYQHLIEPACRSAGYEPVLASAVQQTNFIVLDILKRVVSAEVVLCDLSSRNPNVLYELGIRQAFDKPAVLIKDTLTERIFDVQGLRDVEYDHTLRVDLVAPKVGEIAQVVKNTASAADDVNSLVSLLGVTAAKLPEASNVTGDTALILERLNEVASRVARVESQTKMIRSTMVPSTPLGSPTFINTSIEPVAPLRFGAEHDPGTRVKEMSSGKEGTVVEHVGGALKSTRVVFDDGTTNDYYFPGLLKKI
jgi:hypothetical protein